MSLLTLITEPSSFIQIVECDVLIFYILVISASLNQCLSASAIKVASCDIQVVFFLKCPHCDTVFVQAIKGTREVQLC